MHAEDESLPVAAQDIIRTVTIIVAKIAHIAALNVLLFIGV